MASGCVAPCPALHQREESEEEPTWESATFHPTPRCVERIICCRTPRIMIPLPSLQIGERFLTLPSLVKNFIRTRIAVPLIMNDRDASCEELDEGRLEYTHQKYSVSFPVMLPQLEKKEKRGYSNARVQPSLLLFNALLFFFFLFGMRYAPMHMKRLFFWYTAAE